MTPDGATSEQVTPNLPRSQTRICKIMSPQRDFRTVQIMTFPKDYKIKLKLHPSLLILPELYSL